MIHPRRFEGKTGVITGAAQGIGRAVALNMAREGGKVVLVDRSELVRDVAGEVAAGGGACHAVTADLEQYAECRRRC